jgi:hypothetical protein
MKGKDFQVNRVGIIIEFIKILTISSEETGVHREKPLQAKLEETTLAYSLSSTYRTPHYFVSSLERALPSRDHSRE